MDFCEKVNESIEGFQLIAICFHDFETLENSGEVLMNLNYTNRHVPCLSRFNKTQKYLKIEVK